MKALEVKPGQIWRFDESGDEWLVTRTYVDGFDSYAVLRKAASASNDSQRLKVQHDSRGGTLPGFTRVEG